MVQFLNRVGDVTCTDGVVHCQNRQHSVLLRRQAPTDLVVSLCASSLTEWMAGFRRSPHALLHGASSQGPRCFCFPTGQDGEDAESLTPEVCVSP